MLFCFNLIENTLLPKSGALGNWVGYMQGVCCNGVNLTFVDLL